MPSLLQPRADRKIGPPRAPAGACPDRRAGRVRDSGAFGPTERLVDHVLRAGDGTAELLVDAVAGLDEGGLVGLVDRDTAGLELGQKVGLQRRRRIVDVGLGFPRDLFDLGASTKRPVT